MKKYMGTYKKLRACLLASFVLQLMMLFRYLSTENALFYFPFVYPFFILDVFLLS